MHITGTIHAGRNYSSNEVVRVQNRSPQDVLLQYGDYFELKATESLQAQDKHLPLLITYKILNLGCCP